MKASTLADVRVNAAACELARCLYRMRCAAFDLPDKDWPDLSASQKEMYVAHAHAVLLRLQPIVEPKPTLTLVSER